MANKPTPAKTTPTKNSKKESKSDLFVRLATQRVKKILKGYRILGNCSSKNYEYNQEQINKISETLHQALDLVIAKFTPSKAEVETFEF